MEICQIGAYLFHVYGRTHRERIGAQTDMAKPTVAFRNSVKTPGKVNLRYCYRHPQLNAPLTLRPSNFLITPSTTVSYVYLY